MKIAIVGSTKYADYDTLKAFVEKSTEGLAVDTVVSGGAKGADALAERYADEKGLEKLIFPAEWSKYGRAAGPVRNKKIVEASDLIIAFPLEGSKGTYNTIKTAQKMNKKVIIRAFKG